MISIKDVLSEIESVMNEHLAVRIHNELCLRVGKPELIQDVTGNNFNLENNVKNNPLLKQYINQLNASVDKTKMGGD